MPPVDRNNPKCAASSESTYTLIEFMQEWPTDDACLEYLWRQRYAPDGEHAFCERCAKVRTFRRYDNKTRNRIVWTCTSCSKQVSPLAGTIFEKSSTSLHLWFYAMHLMTSTRCGISAKQLERELGVTYKTAWRIANKIRNQLMTQDDERKLDGHVEADETAYGGRPKVSMTRGMTFPQVQTFSKARKVGIVATVERGGQARATVQPREGALEFVSLHVSPQADTHPQHFTIRHGDKIYASGEVHTQTVEGFFGNMKTGIAGNYHGVSAKWLQGYVNEYVWRYNHRRQPRSMFRLLLARAASGVAA
jgi:transposase